MWDGQLSSSLLKPQLTACGGGGTPFSGRESRSAWHTLPLLAQAGSVRVKRTLFRGGIGTIKDVFVAGRVDCRAQEAAGQWRWGVGQQHILSAMVFCVVVGAVLHGLWRLR